MKKKRISSPELLQQKKRNPIYRFDTLNSPRELCVFQQKLYVRLIANTHTNRQYAIELDCKKKQKKNSFNTKVCFQKHTRWTSSTLALNALLIRRHPKVWNFYCLLLQHLLDEIQS